VRILKTRRYDGVAGAELVPPEGNETHDGQHCEKGDPVGGEPVFLLAFVEDDLKRAHGDGEHADAPDVHSDPGFTEVGRVKNEETRHDEGQDADGDVDVEDPAPAIAVGEPASEDGPEHGSHDDAESPEGHGLAALLGAEGFEHDGLRDGLERAAGSALDEAEDDEERKARREAAKKRRRRETGDRPDEQALAAELPGEPAGDGQNDGVGDEVGGERPGDLVHGGGKASGDVGKRDVDHRGVEDLHKGGQHYGDGDNPRVDFGYSGSFGRHPCPHNGTGAHGGASEAGVRTRGVWVQSEQGTGGRAVG
jgi:hypothetical protein